MRGDYNTEIMFCFVIKQARTLAATVGGGQQTWEKYCFIIQ